MPIIQPKPVNIEGVTYGSYSQAEKALGWSKGSVSKWVAQQQAQANAVYEDTMPISGPETLASDEQTQSSNAPQSDIDHQEKRLIHGGVEYKTRKEMANALHVDYLKLNAYLRKYDDIDEAVGRCMVGKTSQSVSYDGYVHRSFTALCESYGIAPALVRKLAADSGSDKMDAFSDLATLRDVAGIRDEIDLTVVPYCVLQGMPFKSMRELAEHIGIPHNDLYEQVAEVGLEGALRQLQDKTVNAYILNDGDTPISASELLLEIEEGRLEHFDLQRVQAPMYPSLQDVDIPTQCYDVEDIRHTIGGGQFTRDNQYDEPVQQGPVMAGM